MLEYRIFGPPGTGKTTEVAREIGNAVKKRGPEKVVVASFTKAAAIELAQRELPVPEDHVGTLHSLCYHAMGSPGIAEKSKGMKLWNDWIVGRRDEHGAVPTWFALKDGEQSRETADDPYAARAPESRDDLSGNAMLREANMLRARLVPVTAPQWRYSHSGVLLRWYSLWGEFKQEAGLVDFTDMVEHGLHMSVPHNASVLFFDEVQDFSPLELAVVRRWISMLPEDGRGILAGDDDQAIYSFRGATSDAFLNPEIPDAQKKILGQSYRLPREIKRAAETWIASVRRRQRKEFLHRDAVGTVERDELSNYGHPERLIDLADARARAGQSVMLLGLCSYMLKPTIEILRERGIPFGNAFREERGDWNPLPKARARLEAYLKPLDPQERRLWTWAELHQWVEFIDAKLSGLTHGAKTAVEAMAKDRSEKHKPITRDDARAVFGERTEEWLRCDAAVLRRSITNDKHLRTLGYPIDVYLKHGTKALFEKPKICVGTIHSVKGGQADHVMLFPDLSSAAKHEIQSTDDGADNCRRVLYVGMTRAKETLTIARTSGRRHPEVCVEEVT